MVIKQIITWGVFCKVENTSSAERKTIVTIFWQILQEKEKLFIFVFAKVTITGFMLAITLEFLHRIRTEIYD